MVSEKAPHQIDTKLTPFQFLTINCQWIQVATAQEEKLQLLVRRANRPHATAMLPTATPYSVQLNLAKASQR